MKPWKAYLVFLFTTMLVSVALAESPAGTWASLDDQTGQKRALLQINVSGSTLSGKVVKIFPQPGDTGICSKCPGGFKDKPIQGMQIVWGLKDQGNGVWDGGQILDPKTGKVYRVKMTLQGDKLHVRGYVGVSALGRSQVWVR